MTSGPRYGVPAVRVLAEARASAVPVWIIAGVSISQIRSEVDVSPVRVVGRRAVAVTLIPNEDTVADVRYVTFA